MAKEIIMYLALALVCAMWCASSARDGIEEPATGLESVRRIEPASDESNVNRQSSIDLWTIPAWWSNSESREDKTGGCRRRQINECSWVNCGRCAGCRVRGGNNPWQCEKYRFSNLCSISEYNRVCAYCWCEYWGTKK
jgi:hypothetical protein